MKRILVTLMAMSLVGTVYAEEAVRCDGTVVTYSLPAGTESIPLKVQVKNILAGLGASDSTTGFNVVVRGSDGELLGTASDTVFVSLVKPDRSSSEVTGTATKSMELVFNESLDGTESVQLICTSGAVSELSGNVALETKATFEKNQNTMRKGDAILAEDIQGLELSEPSGS